MKRGISRLESPLPPREGGETLQRFLEARVGDRQGDTDVAFPCLAVAGTGGHDYARPLDEPRGEVAAGPLALGQPCPDVERRLRRIEAQDQLTQHLDDAVAPPLV